MTLDDGRRLFGKIYSTSHERADRWYRFGRTILSGELEDMRRSRSSAGAPSGSCSPPPRPLAPCS
jgi:hypothetical protein